MSELLKKSTRELLWGTAVLAVTLWLVVVGHDVPQVMTGLLFALVTVGASKAVTTGTPPAPVLPTAEAVTTVPTNTLTRVV